MNKIFMWMMVATILVLLIEIASGRLKGVFRKDDIFLVVGSFVVGRWLMVPLSIGLKAMIYGLFIPQHYEGALGDMPFWIGYPAVLLLGEFVFYWVHRWAHQNIRFPGLWKIHRTHHSGKHMNVSLLYRLNLTWFFIIPSGWVSGLALYLGMGEAVLAYTLTLQVWNLVTHSNFRWDDAVRRHPVFGRAFRALEHVFVSPGLHHTHHGYGKDGAAYRNFGTIVSVYDWIFGTLHIPEGRPSRYGVPGTNAHWLEELMYPLVRLPKKPALDTAHTAKKA